MEFCIIGGIPPHQDFISRISRMIRMIVPGIIGPALVVAGMIGPGIIGPALFGSRPSIWLVLG